MNLSNNYLPSDLADFKQKLEQFGPQYPPPPSYPVISSQRINQGRWLGSILLTIIGVKWLKGFSLMAWLLGVFALHRGLKGFITTVIHPYRNLTQQTVLKEQYQWQQAQNLLKRYQNRKLREFLQDKVKRGKIQGYCLTDPQKAYYQQVKSQFPHWHIQLGEEVKGIIIPISLVNPVTGLAIALFFKTPEEKIIEKLLENYWIVTIVGKKKD